MPRIDPLQLLKCLSVLLSSEGGISSRDEVPRLVNLMTKFSKKLVSKCVYVLILKNTETSVVDMFMAEGGWTLIQNWLQDAVKVGNWDLVKEVLQLLIITPVDIERLKLNSLPKLIKSLSRREDLPEVSQYSSQIVSNWLNIVKGSQGVVLAAPSVDDEIDYSKTEIRNEELDTVSNSDKISVEEAVEDEGEGVGGQTTTTIYKVALKDGKQVIRRMSVEENSNGAVDSPNKDRKSSKSSSSSKSRSSSSSSRDKDRKSNSSSSKSRSSSKDKDRKHSSKSSSSSSSRSSSSKDKKESKSSSSTNNKEKQADKDKDTLEKIKPHTLDKVGRIPKKSSDSDKQKENKPEEKKKPTFSILNRKANGEERTGKTVKVFNSKMRSTGLEEVAKPPPPRVAGKKPTPSVTLPTIPPKRPSPPHPSIHPEKKLKIDNTRVDERPERPGAIKLIPPKPKPAVLQESDMFMDALAAAAPKKDAKKRKRRLSATKDVPPSPTTTTATTTPNATDPPPSFGFYQDTLSDKVQDEDQSQDTPTSPPTTPTQNLDDSMESEDVPTPTTRIQPNGLKGVLMYAKRKGPKRSIRWRAEEDLVEVRYFELDETERVNVTKTFTDMAKMELSGEREALLMSRKPSADDVMESQIPWRMLQLCDQPESLAIPGGKSLEKDIQFAREKVSLPAIYFDKRRIPDSPEEPIPETHQISDPVIIPLEDPEMQETDLRNTPWPEPKGQPPELVIIPPQIPPQQMQPQQMFPPNSMQNINNPNFPQIPPNFNMPPRFPMAGGVVGPNFGPPMMMMQPPNMNQFGPPMNDPNNFNPPPFNGPPPPMFNNFNQRGRGGFRGGGGVNGGRGGWVQMNGPKRGNWNRGGAGGPQRGGRLCKNVQNRGYCRNADSGCPFVH